VSKREREENRESERIEREKERIGSKRIKDISVVRPEMRRKSRGGGGGCGGRFIQSKSDEGGGRWARPRRHRVVVIMYTSCIHDEDEPLTAISRATVGGGVYLHSTLQRCYCRGT
jgi:hypothetical protein